MLVTFLSLFALLVFGLGDTTTRGGDFAQLPEYRTKFKCGKSIIATNKGLDGETRERGQDCMSNRRSIHVDYGTKAQIS